MSPPSCITNRLCALLGASAVLLVVLVGPAPVAAQSADDRSRARALSAQGAELFRAGDYAAAVEKFREANTLVPHPTLDVNIGRSYEKLQDPTQALVFCKAALNSPNASDPVKEAARKCVERATNVIETRPKLSVFSRPKAATVLIDGLEVGRTPWKGEVDAGRRQVDLKLAGHRPSSTVVFAEFGGTYEVDEALVPDTVGALVSITSVPSGATVTFDGQLIGVTPIESYPLDVQSYALEISKPGFVPQVMSIALGDGQHMRRTFALVPFEDPNTQLRARWPGWTMIGLSVAAAGVGGYFGYRALDDRQAADELARTSGDPSDVPLYNRLVSNMEANRLISDILWGTAGALVVGGVTWLAWPEGPE